VLENLNLNHLFYFHVVAQSGSLARASEILNVTKPTISAQVRQLEDALGESLFDRSSGRLELNEHGRVAHRHTAAMFDVASAMMRYFRREIGGPPLLRVGVANAISRRLATSFFDPLIGLEDELTLRVSTGEGRRLRRDILEMKLDILLVDGGAREAAAVNGLECTPVERSEVVLVAGPDESIDDVDEALGTRPLLSHLPGTELHWKIEAYLTERDLRPKVLCETDDPVTLAEMASKGTGVAVLPRSFIADMETAGRLRVVGRVDGLESTVCALHLERDVPELVRRAVGALDRISDRRSP